MTNPLSSPLVRIAIGAAISAWLTPKVISHFVRPEIEGSASLAEDEKFNQMLTVQTRMGTTAAITAMTFVVLGMATGQTAAQSAATGTAAGGGGAT